MTVKELISFLAQYDDDMVITVVNDDCSPFGENTDIIDAYAVVGSNVDARNLIYITY